MQLPHGFPGSAPKGLAREKEGVMTYVCVHNGVAIHKNGDYFEAMGQRFWSVEDARRHVDLSKAGRNAEANKLVVPRYG
jgi:hypothetical protein